MTIRKTLIILLSLPFALLSILLTLIFIPFVIITLPISLLITIIEGLKTDDWDFSIFWDVITLPYQMYKDIISV